jgi:cell division protease FtsH
MVKLPASLFRSGRFDKVVEVKAPEEEDAHKIIEYYLKDKKISEDVDMDDLSKMISYHSCAELESVLNEAAIQAAFARKPRIAMEDIMEIVLKNQYGTEGNCAQMSEDKIRQTALHEAGHLVASEVFVPGSVGVASIRPNSNSVDGFVRRCRSLPRRPQHAVVSLAGKAAVELYYSEACASGCDADIERAYTLIREGLALYGTQGFGMIDVAMHRFPDTSESMNSRSEAVTQAELERYMFKARDILLKNREFLEKTADALMEKKTLLASDIRRIREDCVITEVAL